MHHVDLPLGMHMTVRITSCATYLLHHGKLSMMAVLWGSSHHRWRRAVRRHISGCLLSLLAHEDMENSHRITGGGDNGDDDDDDDDDEINDD